MQSIVWKINGDIPVNKGVRFLVVLEVEDPDNNNEANRKGASVVLEPSKVSAGALRTHGYEPFYFTSTNPQALDGNFDNTSGGAGEQDYGQIHLPHPENPADLVEAGALHTITGSAATEYLGADEARQEIISEAETVTYKRVLAGNEDKFNGDLKTMVNGMHAEVLSEGMRVYSCLLYTSRCV